MAPDDFYFLARLLRRRSGLFLGPDKMALLERRLAPVMRRFDFRDLPALVEELRLGCEAREALAVAVTEAMTVNETSFFRDPALFLQLQARILPCLMTARGGEKRLRIWSAACAAGQEPYSIAMLLSEMGLPRMGWSLDIVATDLSAEAIRRAQGGRYAACEVERGLDSGRTARHFRRDGTDWLLDESLRRMVTFRTFNLLDSFGWLDDMDIVLCRNVLIYFDQASRISVLGRIADTLAADGVLLLGDSEAGESMAPAFTQSADGSGIYDKSRSALARTG